MTSDDTHAAQLDALRLSEAVRERLVTFCVDDCFSRDPNLTSICRTLWEGRPDTGGLVSELWVEGAFPSRLSDATLNSLAQAGTVNSDLSRILDESGAMPADRVLYTHQREAILQAQQRRPSGERPALVVTAATGAGKTECFLLPILNDLFQRTSVGQGMKCLILYPMNALVNDQVDRLYEWLRDQTRVSLFHFTSETPEDRKAADYDRVPEWAPCRFRTRQEARGQESRAGKKQNTGTVPDIVITNYSMLEYMLCRPQDAVFFGDALQAVVLDEAHLYAGTLAAEITLLLRRLYARCGVQADNLLQIATSATLGRGSVAELQDFAARIFSKDPSLVRVIEGETDPGSLPPVEPPREETRVAAVNSVRWLERPLMVADSEGRVSLAESPEECNRLASILSVLTSRNPPTAVRQPAVLLWDVLAHSPSVHSLHEILWRRKRIPLSDLAAELWQKADADADRATISLLQLAASARPSATSYPLIPHRIHLLVRASDALSVCLNSECSGPSNVRLPPLGSVAAGLPEKCPCCAAAMLPLYRCTNCGEWLLAGLLDQDRYRPASVDGGRLTFLSPHVARGDDQTTITLGTANARRSGSGAAGLPVTIVDSCPHCNADRTEFRPFSSGTPLTLAILAETVLSQLPPYPAAHNAFLPARGRRLLAFSDSRQEAARLGPRLTRQHETQLVRAAIIHVLSQELAADAETIGFLREEIAQIEGRLAATESPALRQTLERRRADVSRQLEAQQAGGGVSEWAKALCTSRLIAEILDAETGQHHQVRDQLPDGSLRTWSQRDWERNRDQVRRNALMLLGREFVTPNWRALSAETLGLAEITYPSLNTLAAPADILGRVPLETQRVALEACWGGLLQSLCDTLRVDGVITFGEDDADRGYRTGGTPVGQWASKSHVGAALTRFVGETAKQRRRRFVMTVLAACGFDNAVAESFSHDVLSAAFDQLIDVSVPLDGGEPGRFPWLQRHERQTFDSSPVLALRLVFPELGLRRPATLFRCDRTGHVWPRTVAGCAPEIGCGSTLRQVTDADLDNDPRLGRLRQEYRTSPVFQIGLWAEEHSAQLSPQQNRRLQDLFKSGIRNILSATTTLELGIDIGGLAAALLSNVPPGKANYLQRAGRAGRRADGSAAVVTFARPRPYDREVFRRFGTYLDRPLRKPLVFLDRERVIRRHLHAFLLGEYFRSLQGPTDRKGAMDAFGNMGRFCGKSAVPYWEKSQDPPTLPLPPTSLEAAFLQRLFQLRDYGDTAVQGTIARLFVGSALADQFNDWFGLMQETVELFQRAIADWNRDYELLLHSWNEAVQSDTKPQANAIRYQLKTLAELTVIEALADRQFLPRYGFPIGLQKLRVIAPDERDRNRVREEDQFRLERSGIIAVGEYVPGSQLLAAGKLITSRGLLKHWTSASLDNSPGLRGQFCRCENDHGYYWIAGEPDQCPICSAQPRHAPQQLLFIKHGFTSAAWDPPKWSTDVERVGRTETLCITFRPHSGGTGHLLVRDFAGIPGFIADYRDDGELLVFNRGDNDTGFAICLRCGYADSEPSLSRGRAKMGLPTSFLRHAPIQSPRAWDVCWGKADATPVLRQQILAARETTDVLLLDFTGCLGAAAQDEALIATLAYAFQNAAAQLLELDTRELGVLVVPTGPGGVACGAVLYDNVAGGAGHVRELLAQSEAWVETAKQVLFVNAEHHARCEAGCLDCLLSFDAQRAMENRPFARKAAYHCLQRLTGGGD